MMLALQMAALVLVPLLVEPTVGYASTGGLPLPGWLASETMSEVLELPTGLRPNRNKLLSAEV